MHGSVANSTKPRSETAAQRTATGLRLSVDELAEIDRRAAKNGMTRTAYMIAASLGKLDETRSSIQEQFEAIEKRLDRLEGPASG
jgi:hypothetical protein